MKNKVKNRKGFTLAELLVVLAILAVLVAVAVPLFTGALGTAKQTAIDANKRAIRSAAVTKILTDDDESVADTGPWFAHATIGADGEMSAITFGAGPESAPTPPDGPDGDYVVEITDVSV